MKTRKIKARSTKQIQMIKAQNKNNMARNTGRFEHLIFSPR